MYVNQENTLHVFKNGNMIAVSAFIQHNCFFRKEIETIIQTETKKCLFLQKNMMRSSTAEMILVSMKCLQYLYNIQLMTNLIKTAPQ